jgi:hypothetical protein
MRPGPAATKGPAIPARRQENRPMASADTALFPVLPAGALPDRHRPFLVWLDGVPGVHAPSYFAVSPEAGLALAQRRANGEPWLPFRRVTIKAPDGAVTIRTIRAG